MSSHAHAGTSAHASIAGGHAEGDRRSTRLRHRRHHLIQPDTGLAIPSRTQGAYPVRRHFRTLLDQGDTIGSRQPDGRAPRGPDWNGPTSERLSTASPPRPCISSSVASSLATAMVKTRLAERITYITSFWRSSAARRRGSASVCWRLSGCRCRARCNCCRPRRLCGGLATCFGATTVMLGACRKKEVWRCPPCG